MALRDSLFPIAVLIDDLKNEDANSRLNAVKRIDQIAIALGPKRTRDEFVPFLCECVDDDDEILIEMVQKLGKFVDLVGGPNYAPILLHPLRLLACADSKLVRDEAVASALRIGARLSDKEFAASFVPMVLLLIKGEWYNHRTSGVGMAHLVFRRCTIAAQRAELLEAIQHLVQDPLPMVRRTVADCLTRIVEELSGSEVVSLCKLVYTPLGEDSQDSVRAVTIISTPYILVAINKLIMNHNEADISMNALQALKDETYKRFINGIYADESWRVRHSCADVLVNVLEGYIGYTSVFERQLAKPVILGEQDCTESIDPLIDGKPDQTEVLKEQAQKIAQAKPAASAGSAYDELAVVKLFAKLLSDEEPEVRCIAVQRCVRVASRIDANNISQFMIPVLADRAVNDIVVFVRAALARNVVGLAQFLGKDDSINHLKPIVVKLLEDRDPEVRVTTLLNLPIIIEVTTVQPFSSHIMPAITLLADDNDWRIRKSVVQAMPGIARNLGTAFFDEHLSALCMNWLSDSVNYIRRAAVRNLVQLAGAFGQDWVVRVILPKINQLKTNPNYLHRINALFFIQELSGVCTPELICQHLLPIMVRMTNDAVPNVRFMAAETIGKCAGYVPAQYRDTQMKPCLLNLKSDSDIDVKNFAANALKLLQ
ncbi:Ser/Thr phosphatase 2A regulatory subunit A [Giardia muris]|uniref:Ser/Thr phosphatase 2A regulatory subunit A n=1 Tax=Giardia muris TaxID=5742 RepID=A0A4Z1TAK4_GIAMU|nr:Ser/Thr phosphatase 2A regulatory subunit A [Giardia muris]|eukprot:TNJ29549.1 Ser/Thr phosphatase 2A regulatory subunit A [Giardia muris]